MKAIDLINALPEDLAAQLGGTGVLETLAKAHAENKAVQVNWVNLDGSGFTTNRRLRITGFYVEQELDEHQQVTGRFLMVAGMNCWYVWKENRWAEEKERHASMPIAAISEVTVLEGESWPAGYLFPVTATGLQTQSPQHTPNKFSADILLKGGKWATKPTQEVCGL